MEKNEKKCQVHLIPTNKATVGTIMKCIKLSPLYDKTIDKPIGQLTININPNVVNTNLYWEAQHLYITSDDEIKVDDYYYHTKYNHIVQNRAIPNMDMFKVGCRKIIATTDKSLSSLEEPHKDEFGDMRYNKFTSLSQPSESFIKVFIDEYNKGNVIKEVMVEYVEDGICRFHKRAGGYTDEMIKGGLKVNPKDNTITIRKIKDSWNKHEHCTDMQYYMEYCQSNGYVTPMDWLDNYKHY